MDVLRWLESWRFPAMDQIMLVITALGSEVLFLVAALVLFWCVDKRRGYYLITVGFFGTVLNQFLKLLCRVPRPWVRDPEFTIVEAARADAGGYSFPSGHTQNAVGTFGVLAVTAKRRWFRITCIVLAVLVPFSRMYLGVHTPADVLTAGVMALALVALAKPLVYNRRRWVFTVALGAMALCALAYVGYVELFPFPADVDGDNLAEGVKNAYSLLGALLGLILAYWLDEHWTHFPVDGVWWVQALKVILGLGITMVLRMALKTPLLTLTGGHAAAHGIRYFLMVAFAGAVWPLTFRWFRRLGGEKAS